MLHLSIQSPDYSSLSFLSFIFHTRYCGTHMYIYFYTFINHLLTYQLKLFHQIVQVNVRDMKLIFKSQYLGHIFFTLIYYSRISS